MPDTSAAKAGSKAQATRDDLSRRFFLDVTQSGHVFIREKGKGSIHDTGGLPVFSTDTHEEAQTLRIRHCRLARDGSGLYQLNEFSGEVEDLARVSELFRASHGNRKSDVRGR